MMGLSDTLTVGSATTTETARPPFLLPAPSLSPSLSAPPCIHAVFSREALALHLLPPLLPLEDVNEGQEEKYGKRMCGGHREET